jgi:hypothetical protein
MKTFHFYSYLTQLFLEWETFQIRVREKIKTRFVFSSCRLWDNVEELSGEREREREAISDTIIRIMPFAHTYARSHAPTHMHTHAHTQ